MKKWIILGVLGLLAIVFLIVVIGGYNSLVGKSQAVDSQWAQVQNVYQRRADLIPNLVSTVTGAANFEKSTLVEVTDARASVGRVTIDASHAPEDASKLQ
jgi:LemA protein